MSTLKNLSQQAKSILLVKEVFYERMFNIYVGNQKRGFFWRTLYKCNYIDYIYICLTVGDSVIAATVHIK